MRAGFTTLTQAFDATDAEIDRRLGTDFDTMDTLDSLKADYARDPSSFVEKAMNKQPAVRGGDAVPDRAGHGNARPPKQPSVHVPTENRTGRKSADRRVMPLPGDEIGVFLGEFERRAKASLDALADRGTDYLAFEALEDFSGEHDLVSRCFRELFRRYRNKLNSAYEIVRVRLPNAFILFCAEQVRACYDESNLWGNLFESLGIKNDNGQRAFKSLVISCLKARGMPTYNVGVDDYPYFYTAMLHGGLSNDLWVDLWDKALLPMAKKASDKPYAWGYLLDGRSALAEVRSDHYKYLNATTRNVLARASDVTLAPMLGAAMKAGQIVSDSTSQHGVTLLSSSGLPDTALGALSEVLEKRRTRQPDRQQGKSDGNLLYLPEGQLLLDLDDGMAMIRWKRTQLPDEYAGDRIDYFVNGELLHSAEIANDIHGCVVESTEKPLRPLPGYDVEIKLMRRGKDGAWFEAASLEQSFPRSRPGCLEFLEMPDKTFRLRRPNDRITRTRVVAYVIKEGREVLPGPGMRAIETRFTSAEWGERTIHLFEVEPGASGIVRETETGRVLASWQEDLTTSVDRSGCIGRTRGGLDLYGVAGDELSDNASLPVAVISAADGNVAFDDLDVRFTCDGRRHSVPRQTPPDSEGRLTSLTLSLRKVALLPTHANLCTLVVKRRSSGVSILTYSFAIVPIGGFGLEQDLTETGDASYVLRPIEPIWVGLPGASMTRVGVGQDYRVQAPLSADVMPLVIESKDHRVRSDVTFALAAVSVEVSETLAEISRERPVNYADACEHGTAIGRISIEAHGVRHGRRALLMLHKTPVFYRDMSRPGTHVANIFSPSDLLLREPQWRTEVPLRLSIFFGGVAEQSSWVDLELLRCREGLGFQTPQVLDAARGPILYLGAPATHDLCVEVFWPKTDDKDEKVVFSGTVAQGSDQVDIPAKVARSLRRHRRPSLRFCPLSLFGTPDYDYSLTINI